MPILTEQQIRYAKSWLGECFPEEGDLEEIWQLDEKGVAKSVNRYCDGGVHGFDWGGADEENLHVANQLVQTYGLKNKGQLQNKELD